MYGNGFHHRNGGFLKNGFAVSRVRTAGTRSPDYSDYDIQKPDQNIDFRRVKNLQVFFADNAESLTTDVSKTEEWQGGDIVIFQKHIGIVSNLRNKNGVPYVIHHNDPWQKSYEQDILEKRDDIVGHYRWE